MEQKLWFTWNNSIIMIIFNSAHILVWALGSLWLFMLYPASLKTYWITYWASQLQEKSSQKNAVKLRTCGKNCRNPGKPVKDRVHWSRRTEFLSYDRLWKVRKLQWLVKMRGVLGKGGHGKFIKRGTATASVFLNYESYTEVYKTTCGIVHPNCSRLRAPNSIQSPQLLPQIIISHPISQQPFFTCALRPPHCQSHTQTALSKIWKIPQLWKQNWAVEKEKWPYRKTRLFFFFWGFGGFGLVWYFLIFKNFRRL